MANTTKYNNAKRVNIYVDEESFAKFKEQALNEHKSVNEKINELIKNQTETTEN